MKIHVLSGDSLVESFKKTNIEGEIIVCRECLVDGDLQADSLGDFWLVRNNYLSDSFVKPDDFYNEKVKSEFEELLANADGSETNLWFEYELFCQVNLWFCLWLLSETKSDIYIVYPKIKDKKDIWKGFGYLDEKDLRNSFKNRIELDEEDILLGAKLWKAFQNKDFEKLRFLSKTKSKSFPTLKEVVEAAINIEKRPKETLQKIIAEGNTEFVKAFQEFSRAEEIYGFGDLQVKKIFDELNN